MGLLASFIWRRDGIVLAFAMLFPTAATFAYFVLLAGTPWMQGVYSACKVFQFCLPVVWLWWFKRESIRIPIMTRQGLVVGTGFGLAVVAAMLGVYYALPRDGVVYQTLQDEVTRKIDEIGVARPLLFLGMAFFLAVLHSLLEEYYWRWFVFGQLRRGLRGAWAAGLSGLAFALHHILVLDVYLGPDYRCSLTPILAVAVGAGGMVWALIYHRTGALAGAWLSHFLVDVGLMWVGFDAWRGLSA